MLTELAIIVALMSGQARVPQAPPSATASACRISGTVVDERTRAGVSGASVILRSSTRPDAQPGISTAACADGCETTADGDGRFEFASLQPGAYTLAASVAGFTESEPSAVRLNGPGCAVTVDIPYRLQMHAQARADMPRALDGTSIASAIAPALTGEAIGLTPGALDDLSRAFQSHPGVAGSQDNRNDMLVRGGGTLENHTRVDGFDVPNVNHFGVQGGGGGALSILPPWLIERGTLEMSGFSVAYGDRMSSVADIAVRPGRRDRVHGALSGGIGGLMAAAEGALGPAGSWLVSGRKSFLDAVYHEDNGEVVPKYADALLKATRRAGTRHTMNVLAIGTKDSASIENDKTGGDIVDGRVTMGLVGLRADSAWSARTSSSVVASISSNETDARAVDGDIVDAIDRGSEVEFRWRADVRRTGTPIGNVLAGAAVKAYRYDYELFVTDMWSPYEITTRDFSARDRRSFTDVAGYAEVERTLPGRGRLLAGVRVDRWSAPGVTTGSPRVKAEFVPARVLRLVGYWGVYRQGVPCIWMASAPGNIALSPITSRQFGGGFDLTPWPWLRVGIEGFDKRYRDYPLDPVVPSRVLVSASTDFESPYVGPLVSAGRVHASGIDAVAQVTAGPRLRFSTNYSHWRVRQLGLDGIWRSAEHEVPHQARVEMLWRPAPNWSTGFRWRYARGRPYTPFSAAQSIKKGRAVYDFTRINALDYPAYSRIDGRIDRAFAIRRVAAAAYVEMENVTDRHNVLLYNWSRKLKGPTAVYQWGRTLIAGVRVEF
jgi:hypothetical protein